ncbi:MAG: MgtC/SapB family protein [Brevinema sp.]
MNIYLELLARISFAVFAGGLIGWERKIRGKPVGIITNTLVCVGATILAIYQQLSYAGLEIYGFQLSIPEAGGNNNGRIVAQIVSGIGFLGAGTIMRDRHSDAVSGITTAATLWIMACLGIVIGSGYWFLSLSSVITIAMILFFGKRVVSRVLDHKSLVTFHIVYDKELDLYDLFRSFGLKFSNKQTIKIKKTENNTLLHTIQLKVFIPDYINLDKMVLEIRDNKMIHECSILHYHPKKIKQSTTKNTS